LGTLTIFAGSASGADPAYVRGAADLGADLARRGIGIVYGGGRVGLMGVLADAALAAGGTVTGVIPAALVEAELAHDGLTRLDVVPDMAARKARMAELADAFVALPGGVGTLEEFFEAWSWQQLSLHAKPVALFNVAGFWDPLLAAIASAAQAGFLAVAFLDHLIVADTPGDLVQSCATWQPPDRKW
jgi:uncharacterized protein (TIGR00730 family)